MKSAEIRHAFLSYFESKGHTAVQSSSLVPGNDPTLLFTNAGMVQFKDVFLGEDKRPYTRATSSQRCVRAGGKHNDLENVGYTARHHTFFEMLGNFSFGDYFKREAIAFAWEFLTKVLKLPQERLWVTVHISDDEAADIWQKEMGVSPARFSRLDEDNFWQMGDTGPCGPSSEIFYDHGEHVAGGPPGSENDDLDRYIEIWNLVFMQFERQADGELIPLPKPSVDTGMGLERIAAVMQNVHSNYEIDLFQALLSAASVATGATNLEDKSLRVIADHIRSCAFLVADDVVPSNEGRGYVLRRIIRRAVRHGNRLGQENAFFSTLVDALAQQMGEAYPELIDKQQRIKEVILAEEVQFAKTLDKGLAVLDDKLANMVDKVIPGSVIFTLYDTYGFPVDLTNDIARERGLTMDMPGYDLLMSEQRARARAAGGFKVDYTESFQVDGATQFSGYELVSQSSTISAVGKGAEPAKALSQGDEGVIVLESTPFYAESGGQAGDRGFIEAEGARFEVLDCQKQGDSHLHIGQVIEGEFSAGQVVNATINAEARQSIALNHSATHLLHAALRRVLGDHVMQKGSLVNAERLRFDFSHSEAVEPQLLKTIERLVNTQVRLNSPITTELCDMEAAQAKGAMALFDEKYGDRVRVLTMGQGFSVELCGGTHAARTGDIGCFKIVSEAGIASGVRRIEALTGEAALAWIDQQQTVLLRASHALKASPAGLVEKIEALVQSGKAAEKQVAALKSQLAKYAVQDWLADAVDCDGVKVLLRIVEGNNDAKALRDLVDQLKNKLGRCAVLLAGTDGERVALVAGVSKDAIGRFKAGDMVKAMASSIGVKGGGRPDMAQGGGPDNGELPRALAELSEALTRH